jgi:hypothetical protein
MRRKTISAPPSFNNQRDVNVSVSAKIGECW